MTESDPPARLTRALADRYRLERELGAGGMATVYLAEDLKHDRRVAIKVLKPELAAVLGAERFVQEIKTTAALSHPHILPLFDSGEAGGFLYYVMPYLQGETIREKLNRETQFGVEEAVKIATDIADALDYAHQNGVIHRDIKPENILLHNGRPMVMDFGIALAVTEAGQDRLTGTGLSLGTPQYMSPEQATGDRALDARSDVYSLGAVVYEMLAGEPPVSGPTAQAVIAKLMTERPTGLRVVRDSVSVGVEAAVAKALAKTPVDRFPSTGEFAAALEAGLVAATREPRPSRRLLQVATGAALVGLVAFGAWKLTREGAPGLVMGRAEALTTDPGLEIMPAISPDGHIVAYSAGNSVRMRIYLRPVGGGRTIPLSDDSTAVETNPRWSPDGSSLLLLTRGGVSVASALGGSLRAVVAPSPGAPISSAAWSPDGREIAFVRGDSLLVRRLTGGADRVLGRVVGRNSGVHSCDWSPTGRWIACVAGNPEFVTPGTVFGNLAPSAIVLFPATGGDPAFSVPAAAASLSPTWSPDGEWLYFLSDRNGPRDVYAFRPTGAGMAREEPVRLTTGLGAHSISLTADGRRMAYAVYTAQANLWALPIPSRPPVNIDAAVALTSGRQVIEAMRVSPDEQWVVYDSDLRGNADIYRVRVTGGEPEQLTTEPWNEFAGDLSPDGRTVAYHSWRTGTRDIEIKALDGGPVERVTDSPAQESYPLWSPDGSTLLYLDQTPPAFRLWTVHRETAGTWSEPQSIPVPESFLANWSPDGRQIAYIASQDNLTAGPVMIVPTDGSTPRQVFDPGPGAPPGWSVEWSPDGMTLYYTALDASGLASIWMVPAAGGTPRMLVRFPDPDRQSSRPDFTTDGRRFYFAIDDRQSDVFVAEVTPQ